MAGLICNHCGQALSGTEKFCPNCGAKVEIPQMPAEPAVGFAKPAESFAAESVAAEVPETEADGEPKAPEFHMDETFDWDLDGYPTGEKKTKDVEFNWGFEKEQRERPEIIVPDWSSTKSTVEREARKPLIDGLFEENATPEETANPAEVGREESGLFDEESATENPVAELPKEETSAAEILSEAGKAEGKRMDSFFASSAENESYQRALDREFANLSTEEGATKEEDALRNLAALASFAQAPGEVSGVKEDDAAFEQRVEESANEFLRMIELEKERADAALAEELHKNAAKTGEPSMAAAPEANEKTETYASEETPESPVTEGADSEAKSIETIANTDESLNGDGSEEVETKQESQPETMADASASTPKSEEPSSMEEPSGADEMTGADAEATKEEPSAAPCATEGSGEAGDDAASAVDEAGDGIPTSEEIEVPQDASADELAKAMLASALTENLTEAPTEETVDAVEGEIEEKEAPVAEPTDSFFRAAKNDTFAVPNPESKTEPMKAEKKSEETKPEEEASQKKDFGQIFEEEKKSTEEAPVKKHTGLKVLATILIILIILELITIFLKYQMPDAEITIRIQSIYDSIYGTIYDFFHGLFS